MTVASKTPISHQRHKTATKKSSLKSTLTAAFSRHASTSDALDEYTRSMRTYLEHSDDVDLQGRSSREPSPEFFWRDLNDIHIPNDALANPSRHESNASSFRPPPAEYSSSHTDTDEDHSSDTSSLSGRISAMHIGGTSANGSTSNGAVVAPTREQQAAAARQVRVAQHQQQYNTNKVGAAGPAWHFYHKTSTPSMLRRNTSSPAVTSSSSSSSSKKHCVK